MHEIVADFSSLASVQGLAHSFLQRFGGLHILFNNAGLLTDQHQLSEDRFELTFAVNHLAPFLLTHLLLPHMIKSAPARIINNSSSAMGGGVINFQNLQSEGRFDGWTAYANTKLANVLFSNCLAEKLVGTGVVSNALCPGLIDTNLLKNNRDFGSAMMQRLQARMRTPAEGAVTPVYLATAPEAAEISGAFFLKSHGGGKEPVQLQWDRETAGRLWDISMGMVAPWLDAPL